MRLENTDIEFLRFHFAHRSNVPAIPRMTLSYIDVTYCLAGRMSYLINGEQVDIFAGDAIIIPYGAVRERFFTDMPNYYASFNIILPEGIQLGISGAVRKCVDEETLPMLECFEKCFTSVTPHRIEKCASIFSYLYNALAEVTADKPNDYVRTVMQYVEDHISDHISLDSLAKVTHLAPQYLCSIFKRHTGTTPMQYVTERRIDHAKRLIHTHGIPLYAVAERCGFPDYNRFSHVFRKHEGISAAKYRSMKRKA